MKRKFSVLLLLTMLFVLLTGCGIDANIKVNPDKTATMTATVTFNDADIDKYAKTLGMTPAILKLSMLSSPDVKTSYKDGKAIYSMTETEAISKADFATMFARYDSVAAVFGTDLKAVESTIDADTKKQLQTMGFKGLSDGNLNDFDYFTISYTFPQTVVESTGAIATDGKTVNFDAKKVKEIQYVVFNKARAHSASLKFAGLKAKKTYKANKNNVLQIKGSGVITKITVKKGSKTYKFPEKAYTKNKMNGYDKLNFTEKGNYTVKVKNLAGKTKTIKFTVK